MIPPCRLRPVALLIGDSLTQYGFGTPDGLVGGWASRLAVAYIRRCDVLNRGFSGYNTRHVMEEVLPTLFSSDDSATATSPVLFCTLWLGANDAALPGEPQHVALEDYRAHLTTLLETIRLRIGDTTPIFLLTPPPVHEVMWTEFLGRPSSSASDRRNGVTRTYRDVCLEDIATRDEFCYAIDVWKLLGGDEAEISAQYLSDGLHLNEAGNKLVFDALMDSISEHAPHILPDDRVGSQTSAGGVPMDGKLWRDLC